jgi:hypothetical protein
MIVLARLVVAILGAWLLAQLASAPLNRLAEQIAGLRP